MVCIVEILEMCFSENGAFHWEVLSQYFENSTEYHDLTDSERLSKFYCTVIGLFNTLDFSNDSLIARIIDLLSVLSDPDIRHHSGDTYMESICEAMNLALVKRQQCDDFHICRELDFEQVSKAVCIGHVDLMKILVRYGVCQNPDIEDCGTSTKEKITSGSRKFNREDLEAEVAALIEPHQCNDRCINDFHYRMPDYSRRNVLISATIEAVFPPENGEIIPNAKIDFLQCYELYFQTVADPLITLEEVGHFLVKGSIGEDLPYITRFLDHFRRSIPKSVTDSQPRSLLHLSRCQVRKDLRKNGTLPSVVSEMLIPVELKALILADDEHDFIA